MIEVVSVFLVPVICLFLNFAIFVHIFYFFKAALKHCQFVELNWKIIADFSYLKTLKHDFDFELISVILFQN